MDLCCIKVPNSADVLSNIIFIAVSLCGLFNQSYDETTWFVGEAGPNENVTCFEFNHTGSGAIGSYIVLPPADTPMTFQELCSKNSVTYTSGCGYYSLIKTEKVSTKKDMVIHNTENDTFIIGAFDCRKELKLDQDINVTITKKNIPAN